MTLLQDKKLDRKQANKANNDLEEQAYKSENRKVRKRDKKSKAKKDATLDRHRKNLFPDSTSWVHQWSLTR